MNPLDDWGEFIAAITFFLLSHSIPVRPPVKAALVARLGHAGYIVAYSALSIVALAWLIMAAGRAPAILLWSWAPWQNHVTFAAMALACAVAALAIGRPNPLSFGGTRNRCFDPADPGVVGWVRHPLLIALLFWSTGHLLPNGQLAHVILFGLFAGFSWLGMRLIDRRMQRQVGQADWQRLASTTRRFRLTPNGLLRLAAGAGVYLLLVVLHGAVIGIQPTF